MRRPKTPARLTPARSSVALMRSPDGVIRDRDCCSEWIRIREAGYSSRFAFPVRPVRALKDDMDTLRIRGARTHNLKNLNIELPREKLVVITGLSGSGKSSLAFDTLYAEGQRRYVESFSAYARQF
ncbi:MAG: hypothetical protein O2975_01160, partial [Proteobacteria bacterium]|nr:hypothetical protein [Pseudomonadota bacterium]